MKNSDPNLIVRFAQSFQDVRAAQRLRYRVFVEELGAKDQYADPISRLEIDEFDERVQHLCLIDLALERTDPDNCVVGVYRLITQEVAKDIGGFYSESEFDLGLLKQMQGRKLELGRSCIAPEYRGGAAMAMLWSGLGAYVEAHQIEYLFGSASFQGLDIEAMKMPLANLYHRYLAPEELRVKVLPENGLEMNLLPKCEVQTLPAMRDTPSLIKAYLRLGGVIGDGAYIDRNFNTVDVFVSMKTREMVQKYRMMYSR